MDRFLLIEFNSPVLRPISDFVQRLLEICHPENIVVSSTNVAVGDSSEVGVSEVYNKYRIGPNTVP